MYRGILLYEPQEQYHQLPKWKPKRRLRVRHDEQSDQQRCLSNYNRAKLNTHSNASGLSNLITRRKASGDRLKVLILLIVNKSQET